MRSSLLANPFPSILTGFAFVFPIIPRVSSFFILLLGLAWLFKGLPFKNWKAYQQTIFFWMIGLFTLYTANLLVTPSILGLEDLGRKLSLLLFPIILITLPEISTRLRENLLLAFATGTLGAALFLFGVAFYDFLLSGNTPFFYEQLVAPLHHHPTYLSLYSGFSIFIFAKAFLGKSLPKWILIPSIIVLTIFILLLASRMGLLTFLALFFLALATSFYQQKKYIQAFVVPSILTFGLLALSLQIPVTKMRMEVAVQEQLEQNDRQKNVRLQIWEASILGIQEHPVLGVGLGNTQTYLNQQYEKLQFTQPFQKKLNAHNQYLQTLLCIGLLGIFLLFFLGKCALEGWKKKDPLFLLFTGFIILNMLTESMLETERGVHFISFFSTLFLLSDPRETNNKR